MKTKILTIIFISLIGCNQSKNEIKQIKKITVMKKIDSTYLKKIKEFNTQNEKLQLTQNDTIIELKDQGKTYFESKRKKDESFSNYTIYDKKNSMMIKSGTHFYNCPVGIYKKYNEKGELIEEINRDENFTFSIYSLIEKIKKTYDINLNDGKQSRSINRGIDDQTGKLIYKIKYDINAIDGNFKYLIIDAKNGEIISQGEQQIM